MDIDLALGNAIATHRHRAGLKQTQVSVVDQGGLSKIERGKLGVSSQRLDEIARALGTRPSAIWATAEEILAPGSEKLDRFDLAAEEVGAKKQFHIALAHVAEGIISTTPTAAPALLELLSQVRALAKGRPDKDVLSRLIDQAARAPSRSRSGASRARKSSR